METQNYVYVCLDVSYITLDCPLSFLTNVGHSPGGDVWEGDAGIFLWQIVPYKIFPHDGVKSTRYITDGHFLYVVPNWLHI